MPGHHAPYPPEFRRQMVEARSSRSHANWPGPAGSTCPGALCWNRLAGRRRGITVLGS